MQSNLFGLFTAVSVFSLGAHGWPSLWQLPLLQLRGGDVVEEDSRPEAPLLKQLQHMDAKKEPEKAFKLHNAIADLLRADEVHLTRALSHLKAAHDAASLTDDADGILGARLKLAEAYIEAGQPQNADKELQADPPTSQLLSPDNFWEFSVKLDRASGRANFDLGSHQMALEIFEDAATRATEPEDIVRLACDVAAAHACLGQAQNSLEPLRKALAVLEKAYKAEILMADSYKHLSMKVHSRLGEAYHSLGDRTSAKMHYDRVFQLDPQSTSLEQSVRILENAGGPQLHCPGGARKQVFHMPVANNAGQAFKSKIAALLADGQHHKAEAELWSYLETQRRPYKSLEAADTLNSLGNLYLTNERKSFYKAGQCFIKAMQASLSCCGSSSQQSKAAYKGLSFVKDILPQKQQATATSLIERYVSAADRFGNSASDLGQKVKVAGLSDIQEEYIKV